MGRERYTDGFKREGLSGAAAGRFTVLSGWRAELLRASSPSQVINAAHRLRRHQPGDYQTVSVGLPHSPERVEL